MSAALLVAVLGLVLAFLSLGWQALTWFRSGPVIKLSTSNQFPIFGAELGEHCVCLTVTNTGRAATTINAWGVEFPGGGSAVTWNDPKWFTSLPQRLEPHSSVDLRIQADQLRTLAAEQGASFSDLRPWVTAGNGKRYYARGVPLK